jgi:hypothetical protein
LATSTHLWIPERRRVPVVGAMLSDRGAKVQFSGQHRPKKRVQCEPLRRSPSMRFTDVDDGQPGHRACAKRYRDGLCSPQSRTEPILMICPPVLSTGAAFQ